MSDTVWSILIVTVGGIITTALTLVFKRLGVVHETTQAILPMVNGKLTALEDKVTLLQRVIVEMGQSGSYTLKRSTDGVPAGTVVAPIGVTVKREDAP